MHVWHYYQAIESVWARENFFHKHTLSESYRENTHTHTHTHMHERIHQDTLALIHTYPHIHTHTNCEQDGQSQEFRSSDCIYVCFSGKWKCTAKALRALCWWRRGGRGKGVCCVYKKGVFIWTPVNALGLCRGGQFVAVVWTCFAQTYVSFAQIFDLFSERSFSNQNTYVR